MAQRTPGQINPLYSARVGLLQNKKDALLIAAVVGNAVWRVTAAAY